MRTIEGAADYCHDDIRWKQSARRARASADQQKTVASVFKAFAEFRTLRETYRYMCERRGRHQILGSQQFVTMILKMLPRNVAAKVMETSIKKEWQPMECLPMRWK